MLTFDPQIVLSRLFTAADRRPLTEDRIPQTADRRPQAAVTDMRYSLNLCDEETDFRQRRKRVVFEAMRKLLRERGPKEIGEVTTLLKLS